MTVTGKSRTAVKQREFSVGVRKRELPFEIPPRVVHRNNSRLHRVRALKREGVHFDFYAPAEVILARV